MKLAIIIGIMIIGVIGTITIFSSLPLSTWQDHRTDNLGVASPDEISKKIDCLSNGGTWEFTSCSIEKQNQENEFTSCTFDWYITGYFLPFESDYSGKLIEISVNKVKQLYLEDFLKVVKIEGWGKTNAGNYLGWNGDSFIVSDSYLDSHGNDLIVGMIAVDSSVIKQGSELIIPTLPEPWSDMVFSVSDMGPSIVGKHIDVFTGEGINAENETFRITSENNRVCVND